MNGIVTQKSDRATLKGILNNKDGLLTECEVKMAVYKTYTTGQLRIKTVFQNNNIQDSFHAFFFIFIKSSKFNSWGVKNIQKSRDTLGPVFNRLNQYWPSPFLRVYGPRRSRGP